MSQPRVSRQIAILKQSKIIKGRREGKWIYYRIAENAYTKYLMTIISFLPDWLSTDPEFNNDKSMLQKISTLKNKLLGCECILTGGAKNGE
jgi:DNA-binding transcriptional ArsR family regulator